MMVQGNEEHDPRACGQGTGLLRDERGLTTIEYIIVLCLIAVVGFAVWKNVGNTVKAKGTESRDTLDMLSGTAATGSMGGATPPAM